MPEIRRYEWPDFGRIRPHQRETSVGEEKRNREDQPEGRLLSPYHMVRGSPAISPNSKSVPQTGHASTARVTCLGIAAASMIERLAAQRAVTGRGLGKLEVHEARCA